ncbi:MAG: cyclic nucleotide-binding domain-containing protein [Vicinamibacteria bacterium]|jgi:CRP-like cAMP-binding protein|nr:cyclic nucleotide-binding domain-containing protein [Vicinamibacteria bacterium]
MVMSFMGGARQESLPELLARKKYDKAIEMLKAQFRQRGADPRLRMQFADVLVMAGRAKEAVPVLIGLADEYALEGFAAKAIALLKKIEKIAPGRADVERKLAHLIKEKQRPVVDISTASLPEIEIGFEPSAIPAEPAPAPETASVPAAPEFNEEFQQSQQSAEIFRDQLLDALQESLAIQNAAAGPAAAAPPVGNKGLLFEDFSNDELVAVMHGLELISFDAGDIIITEGEPGDSLFILTTGQVKAFVKSPSGKHIIVRVLDEGSFFGEISVLRGTPRTATVTAATRCELLVLDKATLDTITATHPRVRTVLEDFYRQRAGSEAETQVRMMS